MALFGFGKKNNGDYFIKIIETITETSSDMKNLKEGFVDHLQAGRKQRDEDKLWQRTIDLKIADCSESGNISIIRQDVNDLKSDKELKKGKIMGVKLVYAAIIGALVFTGLILGILWRLGLL